MCLAVKASRTYLWVPVHHGSGALDKARWHVLVVGPACHCFATNRAYLILDCTWVLIKMPSSRRSPFSLALDDDLGPVDCRISMGRFPWLKKRSEAVAAPVQFQEVDGKAGRRGFGTRDAGKASAQAMDVDEDQSRRDSLSNLRCVSTACSSMSPPAYEDVYRSETLFEGVAASEHVRPPRPECCRGWTALTGSAAPSRIQRLAEPRTSLVFRTVTNAHCVPPRAGSLDVLAVLWSRVSNGGRSFVHSKHVPSAGLPRRLRNPQST